MTKSDYVVCLRNFEYNDEGYTWTEGGNPCKVFDKKEDAEAYCEGLNCEAMVNDELHEYCESYDYLFNGDLDKVADKLIAVFGDERIDVSGLREDESPWEDQFSFPKDMTVEEWRKVQDLVSLRFYYVRAVPRG